MRTPQMKRTRQLERRDILEKLPEVLEYTGEFGAELVLFTPFCEWLSSQGILRGRSIRIYAGMRCFYDQMKCRPITEKVEDRRYIAPGMRPEWMPIKSEHKFDIAISNRFFRYPDLRGRFSRYPVPEEIAHSAKPLLIIHNKYNIEWDGRPVNYISLDVLDEIFRNLKCIFTVIYIRHGVDAAPGYSRDHNTPLILHDAEILRRYPTVLKFDDLYKGTSNNTLLWLSERLRRSCQGGPPIGDRFDA
jgi:hypothetical protein